MSEFVSFTLGGISFGMVYAALGLSLVLIWRATRILHFAQGAMAMLTTFIALRLTQPPGSYLARFARAAADLFVIGSVLVVALLLAIVFRYTPVGLRMRAAAFQPDIARLLGVRVGRVLTLGWALAGLIGALAGVLVSPSTFLYPNSMDSIFVLGFTAAVLGGLDSPLGTVPGGLVLGILLH